MSAGALWLRAELRARCPNRGDRRQHGGTDHLSDDAAKQVAALTDHRGAVIAGIACSTIAMVLLTAGIVWLALRLAPHAPNLAIAGAALGLLGSLVVLFVTGAGAAAPAIVHGLDSAQATTTLTTSSRARPSRVSSRSSSSATSAWPCSASPPPRRGPLAGPQPRSPSARSVRRPGSGPVPKGSSSAFAVLYVGLAEAVRTLVAVPGDRVTTEAVTAT